MCDQLACTLVKSSNDPNLTVDKSSMTPKGNWTNNPKANPKPNQLNYLLRFLFKNHLILEQKTQTNWGLEEGHIYIYHMRK